MEGSDFVAKAVDIATGELLSIASPGQVKLTRNKFLFSKKILLNMEVNISIYGLCSNLLCWCFGFSAMELKATKDFSKLYLGIAIVGYIASFNPSTPEPFLIFSLSGHRYPKIRRLHEQVYFVLLQNGELVTEDKMEKANRLLPKIGNGASNKDGEKRPTTSDDNASYSFLVGSTGSIDLN
ncbi:hypothetical protein AAG906_022212 [Vitis piasezkii]